MRMVCGFRFGSQMSAEYLGVEGAITKIFESISAGNPSDYMPILKLFPSSKKFVRELQVSVRFTIDGLT